MLCIYVKNLNEINEREYEYAGFEVTHSIIALNKSDRFEFTFQKFAFRS